MPYLSAQLSLLAMMAQLDAYRLVTDQAVANSNPAGSETVFHGD